MRPGPCQARQYWGSILSWRGEEDGSEYPDTGGRLLSEKEDSSENTVMI